jgi:hypothetical protein
MAKRIFYAIANNTSDANFRAWGKGLSDAMTAVGFLKTADTGQIDWSTAAAPLTANTVVGYEIRAFSDALQASNPVVVKIKYGSGTNTQYTSCRISIGRVTNGAGVFVGEASSVYSASKGSQGVSLQPCFVSGGEDRIEVCLFADISSYCTTFWVERVKDDSGENTDLGADLGFIQSSSSYQIFFPKKGLQYPIAAAQGLPSLTPYNGDSFSFRGNLGIFPIYTHMGYIANPNLSGCVYGAKGIGSVGSVMTVNIFGQDHDFVITGCTTGPINGNSDSDISFAMRYE